MKPVCKRILTTGYQNKIVFIDGSETEAYPSFSDRWHVEEQKARRDMERETLRKRIKATRKERRKLEKKAIKAARKANDMEREALRMEREALIMEQICGPRILRSGCEARC
jgi:ATPase subunit of ABC transporter with duplicated ATPase domains